jgi:RimJ/RimL family protein N-acetyltransferase
VTETIEFPVEGITDGSIRLRLRADGDTPAVIEACRDPEVIRWTRVPEDYDERAAEEWVSESNRQRERGDGMHLVIADASSDAFLGSIGIHPSTGTRDGATSATSSPPGRAAGAS